jgi:alkylglycerol monooxygenase
METYAKILIYAIPGFIILLIIEYSISMLKDARIYRSFDTISSLSSGITNVIKDVLGLSIIIISYTWFYNKFHILELSSTWTTYIIAFIGLDFAGYWSHRFEHTVNVFWNRHIIHHSSEEFNLACALRQNISAIFALFTFLLLPCAILGVEPKVLHLIGPIHLFAQFWYHTRLIDKMGVLEYVLVTPSHHRVHHAINDIYIDKNYSQIFIVWDKLFGTFQEEVKAEPPVYGVKKAVSTWNPIWINFGHVTQLIKDAYRTSAWEDKLKIWFMPTGWRPDDVRIKYPIQTISYQRQIKYDVPANRIFHIWHWLHFVTTLAAMLYMFSIITKYPFPSILLFGLILLVSVYANTASMDDEKKHAIVAEFFRLLCVGIIFYQSNDFFGIGAQWSLLFCAVSITFTIIKR